jgi:hypothetical protein
METYHVLFNRELYVEQAGFDGTAGTGTGTSDPAVAFPNCAKGVFYFRTNVGTWNTSGDGLGSGLGYLCDPANTWNVYYTPYTYPHPLNADPTPIPAAPTNLRKIGETTSTSCMVTWDASAMANQLGYHVFSGTSTGVYTSVVNKTAATAAATNSIETMHTFVFPLPGTYYISVTAYSAIGDSAYATEVTCTSTGVSRTGGTRTPTGPRTPR